MSNELMHDGRPHVGMTPHSGRYKWGSGENGYQRGGYSVREILKENRAKGISDTETARMLGISTDALRQQVTVEKEQQMAADRPKVIRMKEHGYSIPQIAKELGLSNGTVRNYLKPVEAKNAKRISNISEVIRDRINKYGYVDVGEGSELYLGISQEKMKAAIKALRNEGYVYLRPKVEQAGNPGKYTTMKILGPLGKSAPDAYSEISKDYTKVKMIEDYRFEDNGLTGRGLVPPKSLDSKRIKINYAEEGGTEKDGVIELRRGVEDISLGNSQYAQVRIAVDGTHYLKGMAVYGDDKKFPPGVDVIFNTNKHEGTPMCGPKDNTVLKLLKKDKDGNIDQQNPFGTTIKDLASGGQRYYEDANGKKQLSVINKHKDQGDWETWKNTLAAQFLSKQNVPLIRKQLNFTYDNKVADFEDYKKLTNPTIKRQMLESFADECDATAVHLKAASLPRQSFKVILPITSLKDNEIYAPTYRNGEQVALVRYPHGGTFEIPLLTVNNNNREGKSIVRQANDAVGINARVAERLSGADFDGDTVMVVPTANAKIKSTPKLKGLIDFDPKESYRGYPGMKVISGETKQKEMGKVTNLIADMTLKGATEDELARAVRHSMVVIDAEKHELNYKQSEKDNNIRALKEKYQKHKNDDGFGGASTLITKAKSPVRIDEEKEWRLTPNSINEKGEKITKKTDRSYTDKNGVVKKYTTEVKTMSVTKDPYTLVSDMSNPKEVEYAKYASRMKALANEARKEAIATPKLQKNSSAAKAYAKEVSTLKAKLNEALKNKPRERQAQLYARQNINSQINQNPEIKNDKDALKKLRGQSINAARTKVGAGKPYIDITDREWEAIQAGAIADNTLRKILRNTKDDSLKQRAMPKTKRGLSTSQIARAKAMSNNDYTIAQIADMLGVSTSTVSNAIES